MPLKLPKSKNIVLFWGFGGQPPKREGFTLTVTSLRTGQKGRSESEKDIFQRRLSRFLFSLPRVSDQEGKTPLFFVLSPLCPAGGPSESSEKL